MNTINDWLPWIGVGISLTALLSSMLTFPFNLRRAKQERHLELMRKYSELLKALGFAHTSLLGARGRLKHLERAVDLQADSDKKERNKEIVRRAKSSVSKIQAYASIAVEELADIQAT